MSDFATLAWSERKGEGYIRFTKAFEAAHHVTRLDAIIDWMACLQDEFEEILAASRAVKPEAGPQ